MCVSQPARALSRISPSRGRVFVPSRRGRLLERPGTGRGTVSGFRRRDLDPLDRRRGRDAADYAALRGSPARAPRLRAPDPGPDADPARPAASPARAKYLPRLSLGHRPSRPLLRPAHPPLSLPPEGPTTKIRSITGPTPRRGAAQVREIHRRVRRVRRPRGEGHDWSKAHCMGSTGVGASTSAWRPTSSRTPGRAGETRE